MRALAIAAVVGLALGGCHSTTRTTHTTETIETTSVARPSGGASVQHAAATADDYIAAVQGARTPAAEADAIRSLRQWEVRNGLTYKIQTVRIEDNALVDDASVGNQPVRAQVTIYRGREVVRTFSFTPKDNRNLVLFGE